jgi:uncharacterized protein
MTDSLELLALQDLDSNIDALGHRRVRLAERAALKAAESGLLQIRRQLAAERKRAEDAQLQIEALEKSGQARDAKRARLEKQLKTVIAPREAEALMHEITILNTERSASDDQELELIDIVESAEAAVAEATAGMDAAEFAVEEARQSLAATEAELDQEVADLTVKRTDLASHFDAAIVTRYDRARHRADGVAIARIVNGHCGACHLDLSRAFIDKARHATSSDPVDCEQCGRWLVVVPV